MPLSILLVCLAASAALYFISFFVGASGSGKLPQFAYAQGYYTSSPKVGITRVIPISRHILRSPSTNALNEEVIPELEIEKPEANQNALTY